MVNKLLKLYLNSKFIRFLLVGGLNTVFGYGVFAFCIFIKLHYTVAALLSTVLGILFNFKTTGIIVFNNNDNRRLIRFFAVYIFMYIICVAMLKLCLILGSANMYINSLIIIIPNSLISYFLMKKFVFNK